MRTKRVTIKDIATEAGVSIALVSFVMNNKADGKETYRVNKETAQRILEVRPHPAQRQDEHHRRHRFGHLEQVLRRHRPVHREPRI